MLIFFKLVLLVFKTFIPTIFLLAGTSMNIVFWYGVKLYRCFIFMSSSSLDLNLFNSDNKKKFHEAKSD